MNRIRNITKKQLFLPVFSMILVMLINVLFDVVDGRPALDFFSISITNGVLFGRIIDILNRGSEIAILALGMTLILLPFCFCRRKSEGYVRISPYFVRLPLQHNQHYVTEVQ